MVLAFVHMKTILGSKTRFQKCILVGISIQVLVVFIMPLEEDSQGM